MFCCAALVKSVLVLTPFVNLTIDESPEILSKLIVTAQQKVSPIHYFTSLSIRVSLSRACTNLSHLPRHLDVRHHRTYRLQDALVIIVGLQGRVLWRVLVGEQKMRGNSQLLRSIIDSDDEFLVERRATSKNSGEEKSLGSHPLRLLVK